MAPQSLALRATVKQADGVAASAVAARNRRLSLARGTLPGQPGITRKGKRSAMVFVVDVEKRPLAPCHPARARRLLTCGKAAVWRRYPFTIILKRGVPDAQPALALVNDATGQVMWAGELTHRGQRIHGALQARRARRSARRQRHTRYRPARFANRCRPDGWLPPSLESRICNALTWVARLRKFAPLAAISQELVRFDMQLLQQPDIGGVEYQQGELAGYEIREYLLEKWGRRCAYCKAMDVPLQIEHIVPRARGGTNRVSDLTLACAACNVAKGTQTAAEFGHPDVQAQARHPLTDVAAVNTSRWALYHQLEPMGLPVEVGTGGRTKWNRTLGGLPKAHWVDAACVGISTPERLACAGVAPLQIVATGRHSRQICRTNAFGFPEKTPKSTSVVGGFRTGDLVRAVVPASSTKAGVYLGRLAVRAAGFCNITTRRGTIQGIHIRYCRPLQRGDGYNYGYSEQKGVAALPPLSAHA
jgi:5-methylcytosine-specific restriction endonuclease McrA